MLGKSDVLNSPISSRIYTAWFRLFVRTFDYQLINSMNISGKTFRVTFDLASAILHFDSETSLTFTITQKNGEQLNERENVAINVKELRPLLYLITWQEASGTTVTQVHDQESDTLYSNWTSTDGVFTSLKGTLTPVL